MSNSRRSKMAMGLWPWRKPQIWRNQQKPTSKTTQSPQLTCKIHICKWKKNQICKKPPNNPANPMPQLSSLNHHTPQHHQNQCRHETPPKNLDLKFKKKNKKKIVRRGCFQLMRFVSSKATQSSRSVEITKPPSSLREAR